MDTPDVPVVKDSQESRPNVTPKSANFGSPIATQESWTAPPRRRQTQQKAKASFLDDDDDGDNNQDEQNYSHVVTNCQKQFQVDPDLDSTSSESEPGQNEEAAKGWDVYNQSPTPHASQAARLPPQSAQPVPRSSPAGSSDHSGVFEALKKQHAAAQTSNDPLKIGSLHKPRKEEKEQERAVVTGDRPAGDGKKGVSGEDTAPRPKMVARKSLANSKVKLAALDVEQESDTGKPGFQEPPECDYSLPASNSSSPAASPAKKRPAAKKQLAKASASKPRTNQQEAKAAVGSRKKQKKPKSTVPAQQSPPKAHSDGDHIADMILTEEPGTLTKAPHEANPLPETGHQRVGPGKGVNADEEQMVVTISSDSTSSFPESDNTDDDDFECPRKVTPSNTRRRTRAAAAESQAAKEAKRKAESRPDSLPNSRYQEAEDGKGHLNTAERTKIQPKQPPKKPAVGKAQAVTVGDKPTLEPVEESKPVAEKPKGRNSNGGGRAGVNRTTKDKTQIKQETVVSSSADRAKRGEASKPGQTSKAVKQPENPNRKPNIISFGPDGPKKNGRSHNKTTTTDLRSQGQQPGSSNGKHPVARKKQLAEGAHNDPQVQLNTTVQDGSSPTSDFTGQAEGGLSRVARASQPSPARITPDHASSSKAETEATVHPFHLGTTNLTCEAECGDASDQFVCVADADDDTAVERAADMIAGSQDPQYHDMTPAPRESLSGEAHKPVAQFKIKDLHKRERRTTLGDVDANARSLPKDVPAHVPRLMKRKHPEVMTVEEISPMQQALTRKTGSPSESFPKLRLNSAALNFHPEGREQPVKKPRYDYAHTERANQDPEYTSNLIGRPDSLHEEVGCNTGDDVFGPGKKGKSHEPSAFVQRLISNESANRGLDQAGLVAPGSLDTRVAARQHPVAIKHPDTVRSRATGVLPQAQRSEQLDDVGKRMLAALGPEKAQVATEWTSSDEHRKGFPVGDTTDSWLSDTFEQRRASDVDERTRAWKKATEPYADSLGETMHKIVNVSLNRSRPMILQFL